MENPDAHHEKRKTPNVGLTDILIAAGVAILLGAGGVFALSFLELGRVSLIALSQVAVYVAALVGIVAAVGVRRIGLASLGFVSTTWKWILIGVGIAFASRMLAFIIVPIYILITGDSSNPQQGLFEDLIAGSAFQIILFALAIGVLAPFAEEMFFRGMVFGWLRKWGFWLSAIISAGLFGAAHGINFVFPASFALGLLNAYAYEKSGSIWPAVVAHMTFNGMSLAALLALSQMDIPLS
ncbi:MAG: CPBP family intramembrane metalloprotease [Actinomycetota bacterium]|jgi:membrane protease YdiL (CAAX protease family)|nr:CPBP family intramembrane metalloprotease [Rubrobacter sp.]MDQ3508864.1 CPBP family intramembrane metalloprotease [Actinomycetota bacterium]